MIAGRTLASNLRPGLMLGPSSCPGWWAMVDLQMDLQGFDRIRLTGDEDCGVGLTCVDCWDGGRPLAYLRPYPEDIAYKNVVEVTLVDTVAQLLVVGRAHLDERHGPR